MLTPLFLDFPAVIDYIIKYIGKPETSSNIYRSLMANVFKSSDKSASMMQLCAAAMNEVVGKRDFTDTETSHLLNELPIVEYSDCFSNVFNMEVRRSLVDVPEEGTTVNPTSCAVLTSREEWYVQRYPDLEELSSYELLQQYEGFDYAELDLTPSGARRLVPQYNPLRDCCLLS